MKKEFLILLFIFTAQLTFSQYESFTKEGAHWRILGMEGGFGPGNPPYVEYIRNYKLSNDTIIDGNIYKFLSPDWGAVGNTGKYVREDSTGKVYVRDSSIEVLLYDFSLRVGDSISLYSLPDSLPYVISDPNNINNHYYLHVVSTDSILVDGKYLKQIQFAQISTNERNSNEQIVWLEGIGDLIHPFSSVIGWSGFPGGYRVLCYKSTDLEWEIRPGECQYLAVPEIEPEAGISIYPNPFNEYVQISNKSESGEVRIFDLTGNLVHQQLIQLNEPIGLKHLDKGLYIFNFYADGLLLESKKLIKN